MHRDRIGVMHVGKPRQAFIDPEVRVELRPPDRFKSRRAARFWALARKAGGAVYFFFAHQGAMSPPGASEGEVRLRVARRLAELRREIAMIESAMETEGWTAFVVRGSARTVLAREWRGQPAEEWIEERLSASTHVEIGGQLYHVTHNGLGRDE